MKVREILTRGDFNVMTQEDLPDGTLEVRMTRRGDRHIYKMIVRGLYSDHEEVISEEVIEV